MRLKIIERGFEGYTGRMGDVDFVDGVSIEHTSRQEARRLASIMAMIDLDTGKNPSWAQELLDNREQTLAQMLRTPEQKQETPAEPAPVESGLSYDYTEESLAEIADKGGIVALRDFAKPYDVRGGSIQQIMASLMAVKEEALKAAKA